MIHKSVQDAVDILDSLLDPRNDMSFEDISTQVQTYYNIALGCWIYIHVDIYNNYTCTLMSWLCNIISSVCLPINLAIYFMCVCIYVVFR